MTGWLNWRGVVLIVLLAFAVSSSPRSARAQSVESLDALNRQVEQLFYAGKYAEATIIAERALTRAERQFGRDHPDVGEELNNLANVYSAQGRNAEAEPRYMRKLSVAMTLSNLAALSLGQNDVSGAADRWRRATAILQRRTLRGLGDAFGGSNKGEGQRLVFCRAGQDDTSLGG